MERARIEQGEDGRPVMRVHAPLTQMDLSGAQCGNPECQHDHDAEGLFMTGRCHEGAPQFVAYLHGVLTMRCAVCEEVTVQIEVAEKPSGVTMPTTMAAGGRC